MKRFTVTVVTLAASYVAACQYLPSVEKKLISRSQQAVSALMKDPTSVQFTEVRVSPDNYVCGFANGKNSFGAYEGRGGFVVHGSTVLLERTPPTDNIAVDVMQQCWYRHQHTACMAGQNVAAAAAEAGKTEDCYALGVSALRAEYRERVQGVEGR